jgi:hypothetical protein
VSRAARIVRAGVVGLAVVGLTGWAALAIRYSTLPRATLLGELFVLATVVAFAVLPRRRRTLVGFLVAWSLVLVWWLRIPPSNDRDWQPDVAVQSYATIDGERVTFHNIRNFEYRTETDYDPHWYDATFDLADLRSGDLVASYWMGDAIAHIFVSFGFAGDRYVAVSIETRKERGEQYSTIAGFFKQYELTYVVADERDLIGLRTNTRQPREDVYVYRTRVQPEKLRHFFLDYVREINELKEHPAFYNTLTTNCTTNVLLHLRVNEGAPPLSWKVLLSGAVRLRARLLRYDAAVRGAAADLTGERPRPGGGRRRRLLPAHPRGDSGHGPMNAIWANPIGAPELPPEVPMTTQKRAYTSPIWCTPGT